jgi:hypothetical protein
MYLYLPVAQGLLFLASMYVIVNAVISVKRQGSRCLTHVWNDVDALVGVLTLTSFCLFVAFAVIEEVARSMHNDDPLRYVSFGSVAAVEEAWRQINAFLLLLLSLVVSHVLFEYANDNLHTLRLYLATIRRRRTNVGCFLRLRGQSMTKNVRFTNADRPLYRSRCCNRI